MKQLKLYGTAFYKIDNAVKNAERREELLRWCDAEYKHIVCEWAGCDEETTTLEMIDGYSTVVNYSYRTA